MSILMRLLLGLSALTLALWIYVLLANARDVSLFLQEIENRQRNQPAGGTTQYSSETQQPSTSKESTEKQEQKAKPQWYKDPQWLTLLVLAIYTAATIVYACFAGGQWSAIRRQGNIMADSIRPWASVSGYGVEWHQAPDGRHYMRISTQFANTGKSPALRAEYYTEIIERDTDPNKPPLYDPPKGIDWMVKRSGPFTIFPDQRTGGSIDDYPFVPEKFTRIMNGQMFIVYVTWIGYEDNERKKHLTRDCRVYSPFINNFVLCISGNEAD